MSVRIGDSIRVRPGINCPDFESLSISGWEGRVINIEGDMFEIEWDSITLNQMPNNYISDSIVEGVDFSAMYLEVADFDVSMARDRIEDVRRVQSNLERKNSFNKIEKRISMILNTDDECVNNENLKTYMTYIKENIITPCIMTGMEDFNWEEPYLLGGWDADEYESLKKIKPSYTDIFDYIKLEKIFDENLGLMVIVRRQSDNKEFSLPLWDLKTTDEDSKNAILISDYSSWMTNYR